MDRQNPWDVEPTVFLTSFWGWTLKLWGKIGFATPGRVGTLISKTTDPFLAVVYVTRSQPGDLDTASGSAGSIQAFRYSQRVTLVS